MAGSIRQLLIAAHVAPTAAIASAVRHLAEDAELQKRLRTEPGLIADAVDELLRLHTPNQGFARTARADAEIRGCPMRAGEQVALVLTAANRDEAVFEEPDEFRLDRETPHLAFGHGPHKCPGARVARAEMSIVARGAARADGAFRGRRGRRAWSRGRCTARPRCRSPCIR